MSFTSLDELFEALTFPWGGGRESKTRDQTISEAESSLGIRLSSEYAAFCRRFGAGELAGSYYIAAPGYYDDGRRDDLVRRNRDIHEREAENDVNAYCEDIDRFQRLVFFCEDIGTNVFGFDPDEITSLEPREYNIWRVSRTWEIQNVGSSFLEFINYIYVQEAATEGTSPVMMFRPARPVKKRR